MTHDPATRTGDPVARQLIGAFLSAVVLVVPLVAALGTRTYGALYLWILIGVGVAVLFGLLLRFAAVPQGLALGTTSSGMFITLVLVGLWIAARSSDPGDDATIALQVGLPAAALAAPVATIVVQRTGDAAIPVGAVICLTGALFAAALGPSAYDAIDDSRDDAEMVAALEAAGVTPYLPEIEGLEPEVSSTTSQDGSALGYNLRYQASDAGLNDAVLYVDVTLHLSETYQCTETNADTCREGDGYLVFGTSDPPDRIVASPGSTHLVASFGSGDGALPDADEIGRALAGADQAEWDEITDLD